MLAGAACSSAPAEDAAPGTTGTVVALADDAAQERRQTLESVAHWLYLIDVDIDADTLDQIIASTHDMVVLDFIPFEAHNTDFPMADVVDALHEADHPKLVVAYLDIGQAEDFRTYWEPGWRVGNPDWIVALDPDGWEGNYPVAYWRDEWQDIWLGDTGIISAVRDAGFDGIYLDWVEAYDDENVAAAAATDNVDAAAEMAAWVTALAATGRDGEPGFLVIGQNAAELAASDSSYRTVIDAIAQEQVWFDGAADNNPPGDCPLPATDADIDEDAYVESLSPGCRWMYDEFPDSTLHVSSEWYLDSLNVLAAAGLPVFTVDYAEEPDNVAAVLDRSRGYGFVPFVGSRALDCYVPPR
jgi:cysteinyl-tRNA synthetase